MNGRYGDWRDDAVLQLKALTSEHQQQRTQLELVLETTPRDSRYSSNLVNLMKAEEDDAGKDKVAMYELNREVDEALALETHNFFERTAAQNVKRWKVLSQKLDSNFEKFRGLLSDEIIKTNPNHAAVVSATSGSTNAMNGVSPQQQDSRTRRIPTAEEMDEESLRLEADYNNNFLTYEGFNLSEAFKSHKLKVDKDWSAHELLLEEDYNSRRCVITGSEEVKSAPAPVIEVQENRWQHPEKQKTLIHTAPVLCPLQPSVLGVSVSVSAPAAASGPISSHSSSAGSAIRAVRSKGREDLAKNNKELERLDRQYSVALDSLAEQKEGAMRWMSRQKIRLMSQTEESRSERVAMAHIIERQRKDMEIIRDALNNLSPPLPSTSPSSSSLSFPCTSTSSSPFPTSSLSTSSSSAALSSPSHCPLTTTRVTYLRAKAAR